ncbi:MAG: hypothetical protein K2Z81_00875 [Cyanobacteria bacterium]|nr:hypothetical protein [Cyanobacteriota bacterium]
MSRRWRKTDETFVLVNWQEDEDKVWAGPLDPISVGQAKSYGGCRCCGRKGVFFKERGVSWRLEERVIVESIPTNEIYCRACLLKESVTYPGPRGRTWTSPHTMLFLVKSNEDLLFQVKLWKSGHKLMEPVVTKYGEVAVLSKRMPDGVDYMLRCPHCNKGIVLAVAPERDSL